MKGLEGIRVLELGELVSAAYAAKLIGDLGADVIKVEEPRGDRARLRGPFPGGIPDPERSGLFLYLNSNKRGATLDLCATEGRERLGRLVAETDILLHNYPPDRMAGLGIDYDAFRAVRPELVMCSITPFGLTGPHSHFRAEEITVAHGGGWGWLSPGALEQPELPPLKAFGHQADFKGGLAAAATALAAHYRAQRTGIGEHIDLSVQAYVATFLEQALVYHTYRGVLASRLGQRGLNPWRIFECRDGRIFLCTIEQDQWERLVEFMGNPEWAGLEIFEDFVARLANADALNIFLQEWIAPWSVEELFHEGQKRRICFAPVLSMQQLDQREHLRARRFFVEVSHPEAGTLNYPGAPYRLRDPWWSIRRPAPVLGEHDAEILRDDPPAVAPERTPAAGDAPIGSGLPLDGIRVVDFSWVWAGPFCALQLAHLGAEVIKLESEARPDLGRRLPIYPREMEPGLNRSGYFNQWNQGKKSLRLNLAHPEAVRVARRLIAESDVVIDNFATGVMDRLGLGYEDLNRIKPDLVVASITGFGHSGPLKDYVGYGPAIAPIAGLSSLTGYPGGEPREVGISFGDPTAGITAAVAICAALVARTHTGRGQHIDVSLWEATTAIVAEGWMEYAMNGAEPARIGNRDPWMSPHACFRCAGEERWVTIACANEAEWSALAGVIAPELVQDPRFRSARDRKANEDELEERITSWTRVRDPWEITRALQGVGVAAFPSMSPEDLVGDPHLQVRDFFARLEHPEVGVRTHAGIPWRLAFGPNGVRSPAPVLGEHTDEILRDVLGYSSDEIERMAAEKIVY